jgi:hypothetical protein
VIRHARPATPPADFFHAPSRHFSQADEGSVRRILLVILLLLIVLLFLVVPGVSLGAQQEPGAAEQQKWYDAAANEFAKKVMRALVKEDAISVKIENRSSMSEQEFGGIRKAIERAMKNMGARIADRVGTARAVITFSENPAKLIWVAQISAGEKEEVVILEVPRPEREAGMTEIPALVIQKEFVIEQEQPILDFALESLPDGQPMKLFVLGGEFLTEFEHRQNRWEKKRALVLPARIGASRDIRGRIEEDRSPVTAHISGAECWFGEEESTKSECKSVELKEGEVPLFLVEEISEFGEWVTGKNYFALDTRDVQGHELVGPKLFSAAPAGPKDDANWIRADVDGVARIYDENKVIAELEKWGSDIAAIESNCGRKHQILATGTGDWTERDTVQAFEIVENKAVAVSPPLELPGPVTALWTARAGNRVSAVVRNLTTGKYEAYSLTITCGR